MARKGLVWLILNMVLLLLPACSAVEAISISPVENHLEELSVVDAETEQSWYGTERLSGNQDGLSFSVTYPDFQQEEIDAALTDWAWVQVAKAKSIYCYRLDEGVIGKAIFSLDYQLVQLEEELFRLDLWGEGTLQPEDGGECLSITTVSQAFYLDRKEWQLLELSDLLDFSHATDIARMLKAEYIELSDWYPADDIEWLSEAVLQDDGLLIAIGQEYNDTNRRYHIDEISLGNLLFFGEYSQEEPILPAEESISLWYFEELNEAEGLGRREIDPDLPMIALTFDDGPSMLTDVLLDILEKYEVRATFFMIGNLIDYYPETVVRMVELECEPANHTWDHRMQLPHRTREGIREQIVSAIDKIEEITGIRPRWVRPPYGEADDKVKEIAVELDVYLVNWSVDTKDWLTQDTDAICNEVMKSVTDGSIVLFHDLYETTIAAVEQLIPQLLEQGYQLVTISELFEYADREIVTGKLYRYQ